MALPLKLLPLKLPLKLPALPLPLKLPVLPLPLATPASIGRSAILTGVEASAASNAASGVPSAGPLPSSSLAATRRSCGRMGLDDFRPFISDSPGR
ncbi:MAG: hypothetical protein E5X68_17505 [Mesorhizobium sp.]|nr:MAG: hypothetical protein EOQ84_23505 [Mesorhizobium sp.]RWL26262.1 MAG: hypothetical protein EOR63_25815 [Mesorhizobium sp.]RWL26884.1 MAG: hypothetical protein EOR58_16670 [Mesorhizobium sp.]RWL38009.1 MAG: hypothetical protein EOR59_15355 [Mesorhizobium sp.]RWL56886.1 MAG: hypothetical protein EOR62_05775 [Mesorhizobium sp.]